ncbi:MAG: hypothetical protein AAF449_03500 [Myxococcota bacterium]
MVFAQTPAQSGSTFKVVKKANKPAAAPTSRPVPPSPPPSLQKASDAPTKARRIDQSPAAPAASTDASTKSVGARPPTAPSTKTIGSLPSLSAPPPPPPALDPRSAAPIDQASPRVLPWVVLVGSGLLMVGGTVMALRTAEALRETGDIEIVFDEPVTAGSTVDLPDALQDNQQKIVVSTVATTVLFSAAAAGLVTGLTLLLDE